MCKGKHMKLKERGKRNCDLSTIVLFLPWEVKGKSSNL